MRVRLLCLDTAAAGRGWTLASVGANARRATEDSAAVAYLGEPDPAAARFSAPLLSEAGIAQLAGSADGDAAMRRLLAAIRAAGDAGSLREAVSDELSRSP